MSWDALPSARGCLYEVSMEVFEQQRAQHVRVEFHATLQEGGQQGSEAKSLRHAQRRRVLRLDCAYDCHQGRLAAQQLTELAHRVADGALSRRVNLDQIFSLFWALSFLLNDP